MAATHTQRQRNQFFVFWLLTWTLWCVLEPPMVHAYLNVFISHKEVMKLMGLEADLFYVHEGTINTFAMHFTVPVPADVHELEFSWKSLTTYPLPYTITIDYEQQQDAMAAPTLSIPDKGYVPQEIETFVVQLPCTGNATAQVPLSVNMLVRGPPRTNDTQLHFKRKKVCMKGLFPAPNKSPAPAHAPAQGPALLGAAACALGLVLAVGLVASGMYLRARKQIRQDSLHTNFGTAAYGSHQNMFVRLEPLGKSANSGSYATIASINKYPASDTKSCNIFDRFCSSPTNTPCVTTLLPTPTDNREITETKYIKPELVAPARKPFYATPQLAQMCNMSTAKTNHCGNVSMFYDANSLDGDSGSETNENCRQISSGQPSTFICQQLIKEGKYGRIYMGKLSDECDVLIKTVIDGTSLTQMACLLQDASMLVGVKHRNVLAPILANTQLPEPPEIAYAHPAKGNLKIFLQKSREMSIPLSTRQLVEFGLQVTKGLAHLHTLGIVHKDIATRNCYLDHEYYLKICDSALSRDLFPGDYQCLDDNECRPLKWMALESLQKQSHYTNYSDIWTLGVFLWELATLAMAPYDALDIFELIPYLSDGCRLEQPRNCPNELYTVMSCCWLAEPKQRPTSSQLIAYLRAFHTDLTFLSRV